MQSPESKRVKVADLIRDPVLPPRIIDPVRQASLKESLARVGMTQPVLVRPPDPQSTTPEKFRLCEGSRRWKAASELDWDEIDVYVRDDLTDQEILVTACEEEQYSQHRPKLEVAWYYARLKRVGLAQSAIAERMGVSEATVSMYVRIAAALSAERIRRAGVSLEDAGAIAITHLATIAKASDPEIPGLLAAAVEGDGPDQVEDQKRPNFEWQSSKDAWQATGQEADLAAWQPDERRKLIDQVGPLLAEARKLEGIESPSVAQVRKEASEATRLEVIALRERHADQIMSLTNQVAELVQALNETTVLKHHHRAVRRLQRVTRFAVSAIASTFRSILYVPLHEVVTSMFERGSSSIEEQLEIEFYREGAPRQTET